MRIGVNLRRAAFSLAAAFAALSAGTADAGQYIYIEEDWELVLNSPDAATASPQLVVQMRPDSKSNEVGLFLVNHRDLPNFVPGGVQLQLWSDRTLLDDVAYAGSPLAVAGEKVTWTQYMARVNGRLHFGVLRLDGTTWGTLSAAQFGQPISCSDADGVFPNYSSADSVANATIVFGGDRIGSLKLVQVRKYRANGTFDVETAQTAFPAPATP